MAEIDDLSLKIELDPKMLEAFQQLGVSLNARFSKVIKKYAELHELVDDRDSSFLAAVGTMEAQIKDAKDRIYVLEKQVELLEKKLGAAALTAPVSAPNPGLPYLKMPFGQLNWGTIRQSVEISLILGRRYVMLERLVRKLIPISWFTSQELTQFGMSFSGEPGSQVTPPLPVLKVVPTAGYCPDLLTELEKLVYEAEKSQSFGSDSTG